jgi:heme exporter protein A
MAGRQATLQRFAPAPYARVMAGHRQERDGQEQASLLRFSNVALHRGGRLLFEALDLELGPGEALHVAGPNGSGKSSLIRLAAGLLRATGGTVERSRAALSDDSLALDREMPLRRALDFWGGAAQPALDALGIAHLADVPVRLLSSGQLKRATLARVAASNAPLWLLDEPLNALDAEGAERLALLIEQHRHSGGAVVAASHQPLSGEWRTLELGR